MKRILFLVILHGVIGGMEANILLQDTGEVDPKEEFFRHLRFYDSQQTLKPVKLDQLQNIPQPGGFHLNDEERLKRSYHILTPQNYLEFYAFNNRIKRQNNIRKLNEAVLNTTKENSVKSDFSINDFIRFKRQTTDTPKDRDAEIQTGRQKREPEVRTKKLIMERDFTEPRVDRDREREARGATKEQWIKQPYPVERPADDNVPSASAASDSIRAPRVHFVTTQQRRGLAADPNQQVLEPVKPSVHPPPPPPPPFYRMHDDREREARSRDRDSYYPIHPYPVYRTRSYEPYRPRYYEPYPAYYDDRDRRYGFDPYDDGRSMMPPPPPPPPPHTHAQLQPVPVPGNKQRRIIYYATLPEVVRSPASSPNAHAEQRYNYRPLGYDGSGRYQQPDSGRNQLQKQQQQQHQQQQQEPQQQQQHREREYERTDTATNASGSGNKTPLYPVKVTADVNVREPKKNPESRIFSEVDRRFTYKQSPPSFQTANDANY